MRVCAPRGLQLRQRTVADGGVAVVRGRVVDHHDREHDHHKDAATRFVNAWRDGNRLAAQSIAVPAAVDAVFSAGDPGSPQSRGCNSPPADSPVLCVYKTAAGELQIRVQPGSDGWIVDQAIVSPA